MATDRQIEANRRNAQRSTGPRTEAGKARACLNALKHGNRAAAVLPVLPHEDPRELARRIQEWTEDSQPASAMERDLIATAARLCWTLERAEKAEAALLSRRIAEVQADAAEARGQEIKELGRDLFSLGRWGADVLLRTRSGEVPAAIVRRLESSAEGCGWLLAQWADLERAFHLGLDWTFNRLVRMVRLLGKEGSDAVREPDLNALVVAADVLSPGLAPKFWKVCLNRIPSNDPTLDDPEPWRELADRPASAAEAREALRGRIGRQMSRLETRRAEHQAAAAADSSVLAEAAAFDPGEELERLHRYQSARHRELIRTVELFRKLRRDPQPEPEPEFEAGPGPDVEPAADGLIEARQESRIEPNEAAAKSDEVMMNSGLTSLVGASPGGERTQMEPAAEGSSGVPAAGPKRQERVRVACDAQSGGHRGRRWVAPALAGDPPRNDGPEPLGPPQRLLPDAALTPRCR